MPSQRTIVRRIQSRSVVAPIFSPLNTSILIIPNNLKTTIRGERFNAFDSGRENANRFIIFRVKRNIDEMEFSAKWEVDRTFAVSTPYSTTSILCMELSRTQMYRWCIV